MKSKHWYELSDYVLIFVGVAAVFFDLMSASFLIVGSLFVFSFLRKKAKDLKEVEDLRLEMEEKYDQVSDMASLLKLVDEKGCVFSYDTVALLKKTDGSLPVVKVKRPNIKTLTLEVAAFKAEYFRSFLVLFNDEMIITFWDDMEYNGLVFLKK